MLLKKPIDTVWNAVKKQRMIYNLEYSVTNTLDTICFKSLIKDEDIQTNIEKIENMLEINSSNMTSTNISEYQLEMAASMYIFLNSCPSKWILFFHDLFENNSFKTIALTSMIILKTSKAKTDQIIAEKIWNKLTDVLNFHHYQTIGYSENKNATNIKISTTGSIHTHALIGLLLIYNYQMYV